MSDSDKTVLFTPTNPQQLNLWKLAFSSQGFKLIEIPSEDKLFASETSLYKQVSLLLLDTNTNSFNPYLFCRQTVQKYPHLSVVLTNHQQKQISEIEYQLALSQGAKSLIPELASNQQLPYRFKKLIESLGWNHLFNEKALKQRLNTTGNRQQGREIKEAQRYQGNIYQKITISSQKTSWSNMRNSAPEVIKRPSRSKNLPKRRKIVLSSLCQEMYQSHELEIKDRRWRLRFFKKCFIGKEAVSWLCKRLQISRRQAVEIGQKCLEKGYFYHVLEEHDFQDDYFYYRFYIDGLPSQRIFL